MQDMMNAATGLHQLEKQCEHSASTFHQSAEAVTDFELRAFLGDCAHLRCEMAADLQALMRDLALNSTDGIAESESSSSQPEYEASQPSQDDAGHLRHCRQTEEQSVAEYRSALEVDQPPEAIPLLRRQFAVIVATCERLRSLEKASAH